MTPTLGQRIYAIEEDGQLRGCRVIVSVGPSASAMSIEVLGEPVDCAAPPPPPRDWLTFAIVAVLVFVVLLGWFFLMRRL